MPFLDEIAARLVAQGVAVINTSLFLGSSAPIPGGIGPYLSLIETGGTGSAKTQNDTATQRPTAQLLSRATSYLVARAKLKLAYDALGGENGLYNITLSGVLYISLTARQNITDVGKDAEARAMLSFNIDCEKYPS